jgi:hypothetical protein
MVPNLTLIALACLLEQIACNSDNTELNMIMQWFLDGKFKLPVVPVPVCADDR